MYFSAIIGCDLILIIFQACTLALHHILYYIEWPKNMLNYHLLKVSLLSYPTGLKTQTIFPGWVKKTAVDRDGWGQDVAWCYSAG